MVLKRLEKLNLKLNHKECNILQTKVNYVSHIISENGVELDSENLDKVKN